MAKHTFESLARSDLSALDLVLAQGTAPKLSSIIGYEFRGWNVLAPVAKPVMMAMGFQRFAKGFYALPGEVDVDGRDVIDGYNVKIRTGSLTDPWTAKPNDENPTRHSFFKVWAPGKGPREAAHPHDHALFLNYDLEENGLFDGRGLRDYMVQVDRDNPDLVIGKAYMKLGPITIMGGFFVAERLRKANFVRLQRAA